jgi:uncharacterized protein
MANRTIVHFEIPANDVARMRDFYERSFGWSFRDSGMPGMEYWLITTGPTGKSVGGGLYKKMNPEDRPRNFVGVEEIDEAIERFKAAGGSQVVEKMEVPGQGWSFIGADPEGNLIALWEQTERPRPARRRRAAPRKSRTRATARGRKARPGRRRR